jgi:hypothetical protein
MLDAMLAIRASESANAATLNCFPDSAVRTVGPFRAVDIDLPSLVARERSFSEACSPSRSEFADAAKASILDLDLDLSRCFLGRFETA